MLRKEPLMKIQLGTKIALDKFKLKHRHQSLSKSVDALLTYYYKHEKEEKQDGW
jgi:hypothetical protein